jgi:LPXTG-motif cell wall-anchored protein
LTSGSLTAIPEPSTRAMMLLGFGLLGGAGYWTRRRSVAVTA